MVEERRASALTESALDAALADAFGAEPSPDFVARVRRRVAEEGMPAARPVSYLAGAAALGAAVIVFGVVMIERRPAVEPRARVVATSEPNRPVAPSNAPTVRELAVQRAEAPAERRPGRSPRARRNWGRDEFQNLPPTDVLIPPAEQQALRRVFERPPTAVLRFSSTRSDEPLSLAAVVIPPLTIDSLSPQVEEGGRQ
jgi:hypothetical protein